MKRRVWIKELSAEHVKEIVAVERRCHPKDIREGQSIFHARLKDAESDDVTLNLGLFANDKLAGYILGHLNDTTDLPDWEQENIIYIDDLAILPRYRRYLYLLLSHFGREIRHAYRGLPVVANVLKKDINTWERHRTLFRRSGFDLTRIEPTDKKELGDTIYLVRWDPVTDADVTRTRKRGMKVISAAGHTYEIRVLGSEEELLAVRSQWEALQNHAPDITVFQTHRYQSIWWRRFGMPLEMLVLCVYRDDQLLGIAPFQTSSRRIFGGLHHQLGFVGTRWEVDRPRLLCRGEPEELGEVMAKALMLHRSRWDLFELHEQEPNDPAMAAFMKELRRQGVLLGVTTDSICPYLTFQDSWEEFLATKSKKFRKNLVAARRKLESLGTLEYAVERGDTERLFELLEEYRALERKSSKAKSGAGFADDPEYSGFYADMVKAFGDTGAMVFRTLRLDGDLISATFGLEYGKRFYSLQITHDLAYAKCSPGTLLESLEIQSCFQDGLDEYDFLGGFLNNKLRWSSTARHTQQIHGYQARPVLRLVHGLFFRIKPAVKRWLGK